MSQLELHAHTPGPDGTWHSLVRHLEDTVKQARALLKRKVDLRTPGEFPDRRHPGIESFSEFARAR